MKPSIFFLIISVLIAVTVSGCVSQAPAAHSAPPAPVMTTVQVAYLPLITNGPLFIAKEEGYFAQQGIDVEFVKFQSASAALPALINGDVAVSGGQLSPSLINAIAKGAHVRIVADKGRNSLGSCNASGLLVRRDLFESGAVTKASDLKGKKIMASSDPAYGVSRILKMGNLTRDDVEIVSLDMAAGIVALRNGAVDAADTTEPYITQALNDHVAVLLIPTPVYSQDYSTPLYYGPAFLDKDPELGRRFMIGYLLGVKQYNEGKTERNLAILGNYTHLDRDLLNQSCWLPIAPDGDVPKKPVRDYMDWMYANQQITQSPPDDQVFDMSFVNYANGVRVNTTTNG
jgi:ABC-type nitrate/sulfonate/bicarbonate transport system substrate-binding protein